MLAEESLVHVAAPDLMLAGLGVTADSMGMTTLIITNIDLINTYYINLGLLPLYMTTSFYNRFEKVISNNN